MRKNILAALLCLLMLAAAPRAADAALNVRVGLVWHLAGQRFLGFAVAQGTYRLTIDNKINELVKPGIQFRAGSGPWGLAVFQQGQPLGLFSGLKLEPVDGKLPVFKIYSENGSYEYRGSLEIRRQTDGNLQVVNTLGEQEYLYGIVPMEMSNSWAAKGMEALKAQAVAARTYLVKHYDSSQSGGYNITDSPNINQAYAGYNVEGVASQAVDATAGEIIVDSITNKPINASYSSNSGGYTEDSENVWGGVDPHLRGKPDPYSLGQGFIADHWTYTASAITVGKRLGMGPVTSIKLQKYPSGRVKTVFVRDIDGKTRQLSGRRFAGIFYPSHGGISTSDFLGSMFSVNVLRQGQQTLSVPNPLSIFLREHVLPGPRLDRLDSSNTKLDNSFAVFSFSGSGWGHGVGMSQWGAYGMAKMGFSYKQILEYYYTDVKIIKQ